MRRLVLLTAAAFTASVYGSNDFPSIDEKFVTEQKASIQRYAYNVGVLQGMKETAQEDLERAKLIQCDNAGGDLDLGKVDTLKAVKAFNRTVERLSDSSNKHANDVASILIRSNEIGRLHGEDIFRRSFYTASSACRLALYDGYEFLKYVSADFYPIVQLFEEADTPDLKEEL